MAKIVIGKTPEQLQREQDERNKERFANIQAQELEQQKQLRNMVMKQKRNRMIVLSVAGVLTFALLIFGTYNTFFKKDINVDDINAVVAQYQSSLPDYSYIGIEGFIRANFDKWYKDQLVYSEDNHTAFDYIKGDLNTLAIDEIRHDSNNALFVRVYFSIDIEAKKSDTKDENKEIVTGEIKRTRTRFYIPIEYHYNYVDGKAVTVGYAATGRLSIYMLEETNQKDYITNPWFAFDDGQKYEHSDSDYSSAVIRVEKILKDMYDGTVDNTQYSSLRPFVNENKAKFVSLDSFSFYKATNAMNLNAYVTYIIETEDGFRYLNSNYLLLEAIGEGSSKTWVIKSMV